MRLLPPHVKVIVLDRDYYPILGLLTCIRITWLYQDYLLGLLG